MIEVDARESALRCSICGELSGIDAWKLKKDAALEAEKATMAADHKGCEEFRDNPGRARIERGYALRMRAALRGAL